MTVNPVSSSQAVQQTQIVKKSEVVAARKQSDIKESDKVNDKKEATQLQAQMQKEQVQKAQEPVKPAVNGNGQKIGTLINIAA